MNQLSDFNATSSSLQDLQLFCAVYVFLKHNPNSSFQTIADQVGMGLNSHKLSALIERLEQASNAKLISRTPKSKNNALTSAAHELFTRSQNTLKELRAWPGQGRERITIAAPHLLTHTLLPKIVPDYRGRLQNQDTEIRIVEEPDLDSIIEKVSRQEISFALIWIHNRNRPYIEYINKYQLGGVQIDERFINSTFDLLMVCPTGHRFADEAMKTAKTADDSPWELDLHELKNELVYTLHPRRQPLYDLIQTTDPSRRVEQRTYLDIISRLRCHVREGVGLVPSVYSELNEMVRKGQLFYAPIKATGEVRADWLKMGIGCITKGGVTSLGAAERLFFEIAREKFQEISTLVYDPSIVKRLIPEAIEKYAAYKYCYFVMQPEAGFGVPYWYPGDIDWVIDPDDSQKLKGEFIARTKLQKPYSFMVSAELKKGNSRANRVFHFFGANFNRKNTISCSFNMSVPPPLHPSADAIVGVWSGRDDQGLATIAPMVLSTCQLSIENVRGIVNRASFRCLPNAEEGKTPELWSE